MGIHSELRTISLCAGGGGLDLGLELAIPAARAVCFLEREAFGIARLVEAMQEGFLADAPVWTDVSTFRGRAWRGLVDGVIGGIPCQPHSYAGQRKGADDERDLWPDTRRIIAAARPWFVWIENVAGMLVGPEGQIAGAARVRRDLAAMSFRSEIVLVRASEVGASHERARVFVLALSERAEWRERWAGRPAAAGGRTHAEPSGSGRERTVGVGQADADSARPQRRRERDGADGRQEPIGHAGLDGGVILANPISRRHGRDAGAPGRGSIERTAAEGAGIHAFCEHFGVCHNPNACDESGCWLAKHPDKAPARYDDISGEWIDVADADIAELQRESSAGQFAQRKSDDGISLFPPGPGDRSAWERIARESPDLLPATTQSRVRGMADGLASRVDQLRMLGNGVVPLQAAYALRLLVDAHARFGNAPAAQHLRRLMT